MKGNIARRIISGTASISRLYGTSGRKSAGVIDASGINNKDGGDDSEEEEEDEQRGPDEDEGDEEVFFFYSLDCLRAFIISVAV